MKHQSLGLSQATKRTRRREFFGETERVVLWTALVAPVVQYLPEGQRGRPPFPMGRMPRSHFMQHCFNLSDPAMEDALHDGPMSRGFAGLGGCHDRLFDDSTVLRFRRALEKRELGGESLRTGSAPLTAKGPMHKSGAVLDATLMAAPTSTNDDSGERHPEMEQSHKGHQWHFGMKADMAVYVDNGPVFTVRGTAFSGNDVVEAYVLPYGQGSDTYAGARYLAAGKRPDAEPGGNWHIAIRPSKGQVLDRNDTIAAQTYDNEHLKASIRIKVERPQGRHPFRVSKRQIGYMKGRYRGLAKNAVQLHTLFAPANLCMANTHIQEACA